MSAFEVTGIEPFDAYKTDVMRDFPARILEEHSGSQAQAITGPLISARKTPHQICSMVLEDCCAVLDNFDADTVTSRRALADALVIAEGTEARALLAESERGKLRNTTREKAGARAQRGRVGRARVYTQEEIKQVLEEEKSRAQSASTKGRGRGRGRARGRGRSFRKVEDDWEYASSDSSDSGY